MTKKIHIPKKELDYYYNDLGWTQPRIAAHYGCSVGTISNLMRAYGLPTRTSQDYTRIDLPCAELRELYVGQQLTSEQIAARKGCAPSTVRKHLRDCGIPLRPGGLPPQEYVPASVLEAWPSPSLAYAVGLFAAEGNLTKGRNSVGFASTDLELITHYCACRQLSPQVEPHKEQLPSGKPLYRIQFTDHAYSAFLEGLGLTPAKSLTLQPLNIPPNVFFDFARGCWDGDGGFYIKRHRGWHDSLYTKLTCGSRVFLEWMRDRLETYTGLHGHISGVNLYYYSSYAVALGYWFYHAPDVPALSRKRRIWERFANDRYNAHLQIHNRQRHAV